MALQGKLTLTTIIEDTENSYEEEVTRPNGEVETITVNPLKVIEGQVFENAYVLITMASIHCNDFDRFYMDVDEDGNELGLKPTNQERGETKMGYYITFRYNIYSSLEDRQDLYYKPVMEVTEDELINIEDLSLDGKNVIHYCYEFLKNKKGFEEMTNI
jgi:hypothetical protein